MEKGGQFKMGALVIGRLVMSSTEIKNPGEGVGSGWGWKGGGSFCICRAGGGAVAVYMVCGSGVRREGVAGVIYLITVSV